MQVLASSIVFSQTLSLTTWQVLLVAGDRPVALLLPYVYARLKRNDLTEWLLINNAGERARHRVAF
jgi:hypothetical protein